MPGLVSPTLSSDDVDALLYLTRVNETAELQQTLSDLTQKYNCLPGDVIASAVDPDSGNTVLHFASANGFLDLVKSFLHQLVPVANTNGVNGTSADQSQSPQFVNRQNQEGNTPLHWAAYNGHLEIVKSLIDVGADMWIKNSAGHLAMFEAERAEKNDVVQHLLQTGGAHVERGGVETEPTIDEIVDVDTSPGEDEATSSGAAQQTGMGDVDMHDRQP
ncbi:ankyrin repeat-containing protein [Extremus antarcticus]|uniref:Ankyrin repeat-containing protein n=1 Tax=Extremus antarcticus TaxID=702011 RepID=A0AAJ0GH24_9PEZI|nr:ankyrin repeat-containing protein [Extremus antarcticus]